jgi:hypothetical protein
MKQLTKKQMRSVDMMVNALKKKYPFILGWKPSDDFLKYDTMLNIDFIVDYSRLAKFFDADTDSNWVKIIEDEGGSYSTYSLGGLFNYDKYPQLKDLSYKTTDNMERLLTNMNEELPDDYRITFPYDNFRGETVLIPRQLRRDHYIMQ